MSSGLVLSPNAFTQHKLLTLLTTILHIYGANFKFQKTKRWRESSPIYLSTPQMFTTAGAEPGLSQETGTPSRSLPCGWQGIQCSSPRLPPPTLHMRRMLKLRAKLGPNTLTWDACIPSSILTQCAKFPPHTIKNGKHFPLIQEKYDVFSKSQLDFIIKSFLFI